AAGSLDRRLRAGPLPDASGAPSNRACSAPRARRRWSTRQVAMAAAKPIPAARISNPPPNTPDSPPRRATRGAFLLGLALMVVAPVTVSAAGVREEHPNLVGGELLGRGFALTLNYERF